MRPTKLEIQGMTAYRQRVEVDFSELDLFAITGETGAGKSSLVDAISFALFGQAPRVGTKVRELISQGEDRLKVSLEFSSNSERYRIHRSTARKGQPAVQLERADASADDGWERLADRATEATNRIEAILQMDYEAFVRSVLLPQGQFQEFLAGDRDQRRKVLDRLLDLEVYERMARRANAMAHESEREAERIGERLRDELAGATPEALKSAKAGLKALQGRAKEVASLREATEAACRTAEALVENQKRREAAAKAGTAAAERLNRARELMLGGEKALEAAGVKVAAVQAAIKAAEYDPALHIRLSGCLPILRSLEEAEKNAARLAADMAKASTQLTRVEQEESSAREAEARAASEAAGRADAFEKARHQNAAAVVSQGLKSGEPCPICGVPLTQAPRYEQSKDYENLKTAADKAKLAEKAAHERVVEIGKRLAAAAEAVASIEKGLASTQAERERRAAELAKAMPGERLDGSEVEQRIRALEKARTHLDELTGQEKTALAEREKVAGEISSAKSEVAGLETQAKAHAAEAESLAKVIAEIEAGLRTAAGQMEWRGVTEALDGGRDPTPLLRQHLQEAQREESATHQEIGAAGKHIEQTESNIDLAKKLRGEEKSHRESASLAKDLASLLRIDALPSFIREEALRRLAEDGSQRLSEISRGRYEFAVDGQDFLIVDRWNGGESRSVRTLSGGETFLASLALALALAAQLPTLAGHGTGSPLESLFIDEGFSHLDEDTLNTVASALEVLGEDRRRLIGVITHVPALAERMPARITVHKSQTGSTVTVE